MASNAQTPYPRISPRPPVEQSPDPTMRLSLFLETVFKSSTHLCITIQWGAGGHLGGGEVTGSC
jgi:hypothetical protein